VKSENFDHRKQRKNCSLFTFPLKGKVTRSLPSRKCAWL